MDENYQKLYDAVSAQFDIGDFNVFKSKMTTPEERKSFFDKIGEAGLDLGDYETYENKLKKKEAIPEGTISDPFESRLEFGYGEYTEPKPQTLESKISRDVEDYYRMNLGSLSPSRKYELFEAKLNALEGVHEELLETDPAEYKRVMQQEISDYAQEIGINYNPEEGTLKLFRSEKKIYDERFEKIYNKRLREFKEETTPAFASSFIEAFGRGAEDTGLKLRELLGQIGLNYIPGYRESHRTHREFNKIKAELGEDQRRYDKTIEQYLKEGEYGKALGNATLGFAESAPALLIMAMGGVYGGLGTIGATEYAGRTEALRDSDLSEAAIMGNAAVYALSEVVFERISTYRMLRATGKSILNQGVDNVRRTVKRSFETSLNRYAASLKRGGTYAVIDMNSEVSTKLSQNVIDQATIDPNKDLKEGLVDAAAISLVTTGAIRSPLLAAKAPQEVRDLAAIAINKLPSNIPLLQKVKAGLIITEKEALEAENATLDPAFQEVNDNNIEDLNSAAKIAIESRRIQQDINDLNNEINNELNKKFPDVNKIAEAEENLKKLEVDKNISYGGRVEELTKDIEGLKEQRDKLYEGEQTGVDLQKKAVEEKKINSALKDLMLERQKIKNNINEKAFGDLNAPLNKAISQQVGPKLEEDGLQENGLQEEKQREEEEITDSRKEGVYDPETETKDEGTKDELLDEVEEKDVSITPPPSIEDTKVTKEEEVKPEESVTETTEKVEEDAKKIGEETEEAVQEEGLVEEEVRDVRLRDAEKDRLEAEKEEKIGERKLGKKALDSAKLPDDFKASLRDKGIEYAVRGRKVSNQEAVEIAKVHDRVSLKHIITNPKSDIAGDTRTTLAVGFAEESIRLANISTDSNQKARYMQDAVDVFEADMMESTKQAQAFESKKQWGDLIGKQPELIVKAAEERVRKNNKSFIEDSKEDIKDAKSVFDSPEVSKKIKELEEELKIAQAEKVIFGKNDAKKIADKIRKAKLPKDIAFATPIPIQMVWDPMVETVAKAVELTGNISESIQKGLTQARNTDWYKGLTKEEQGRFDDYVIKRLFVKPVQIPKLTESMVNKIRKSDWYKKISEDKKEKFNLYVEENVVPKKKVKRKKQSQIIKERLESSDWYKSLTEEEQQGIEDLAVTPKQIKPKKSDIDKIADKVYRKMERGTRAQAKQIVINYFHELNEAGKVDDAAFQSLYAKALGQDHLTNKQKTKMLEAAEKLNVSREISDKLNSLYDKAIASPQDANVVKEIKVLSKRYNKAIEEARVSNAYIHNTFGKEHNVGSLLGTFIQGNLLTLTSQVTNVVSNATWQPVRSLKNTVATGLDFSLSQLGKAREKLQEKVDKEKSPRLNRLLNRLPTAERTFDTFGASRGYFPGVVDGFVEGLQQIRRGQMADDVYAREVSKALHPLHAMTDLYRGLTGKEKLKAKQYVTKTLEATLGVAPEITFRLLNMGDKPFRRAAERARLSEIAKIKGLKGVEREQFMKFPDEKSADDARQAGLESTFQQDNIITDAIKNLGKTWDKVDKKQFKKADKVIRGVLNVLAKTQMPYIKTPTNILIETIPYARPEIGLMQAAYYANEGNRRKATDFLARAMVGYMFNAAFTSLFAAGVISLALGGREDEEKFEKRKATTASYRDKPAYTINTDAFLRYMSGEDPTWQEGDNMAEGKRFGILSSMMMIKAESFRGKSDKEIKEMSYKDRAVASLFPTLKSSLDQSFLTGVNSALQAMAIGGYEADRWLLNTSSALSATVIPNTYSTAIQAYDDNLREIKEPTLKDWEKNKKEILNKLKSRTMLDSGLPSKVTLWGEKVSRVPDGKSPLFSLFDVTKSRKYGGDFGVKIYELYDRTKNGDVLPNPIRNSISIKGKNVKLTPKLYEELQIEVGTARKLAAQMIVNSKDWEEANDETKVKVLDLLYKKINKKDGYVGVTKRRFMQKNEQELIALFKTQYPEEAKALNIN